MTSRIATTDDRNLAHARLQGLGAWNGNGLLMFLASTSKKDSSREWMEPLRDLAERVVEGFDQGQPVELSDEEASTFDDLQRYQNDFFAALGEGLNDEE